MSSSRPSTSSVRRTYDPTAPDCIFAPPRYVGLFPFGRSSRNDPQSAPSLERRSAVVPSSERVGNEFRVLEKDPSLKKVCGWRRSGPGGCLGWLFICQILLASTTGALVGAKTVTKLPFDPSVPDFATGSETQYHGDEEYMQGCMWTFRQLAEVCHSEPGRAPPNPNPECAEASIMAHQTQDELRRFYATLSFKGGKVTTLIPKDEEEGGKIC